VNETDPVGEGLTLLRLRGDGDGSQIKTRPDRDDAVPVSIALSSLGPNPVIAT